MSSVQFVLWGLFLGTLNTALSAEPAAPRKIVVPPPLTISKDTKLNGGTLRTPLVISESNITIDGAGVTLVGATGAPKTFAGVAIFAKGVKNVTLKNIHARGWETGLNLVDCEGWTIENCDFSNNFHDPDFGWGENGRRGGIVLERVHRSTLRNNRANTVWDACVLVDSNDNVIENNHFAYTSNTCLKLWQASRNVVCNNNLSYGIRINPGEVHARDSTSVLIESGSNDNQLIGNDCTYGGDGIFVRVLNGWCSTGNLFERNDCSYANNNGFECWAQGNTFRRNKANHCSYGFWLGGSDQTVLDGNEASYNGLPTGYHNSPHLPESGHAGIVFMFGPSSHTVARNNTCIGNNGAGIAVIGDLDSKGKKWKAYHWIIENNLLSRNRWGIYTQYADWLVVKSNQFHQSEAHGNDNIQGDLQTDASVSRLVFERGPRVAQPEQVTWPQPRIEGPNSTVAGQTVEFRSVLANPVNGPLQYAWDLGDGTASTESLVRHMFPKPGFYRIGMNAANSAGTGLAWRNFYVVDNREELGTEGHAERWAIEDFHERTRSPQQTSVATFANDTEEKLVGKSSVKVLIQPYAGFRAALTYPQDRQARLPLEGKSKLVFWMKVINEDVTGWQGGPFVVLHGPGDQKVHLEPKPGLDLMRQVEYNEGRDGWRLVEIPLQGNDQWKLDGVLPTTLQAISICFDSWGAPTLQIWLDGLSIH